MLIGTTKQPQSGFFLAKRLFSISFWLGWLAGLVLMALSAKRGYNLPL